MEHVVDDHTAGSEGNHQEGAIKVTRHLVSATVTIVMVLLQLASDHHHHQVWGGVRDVDLHRRWCMLRLGQLLQLANNRLTAILQQRFRIQLGDLQ